MQREPVWIGAIVRGALVALGAFGFDLSAEEIAVLVGAVEVVAAVIVRNRVTPVEGR